MRSISLTLLSSALSTNASWVNASLRFLLFFVKMWLLNACFLLILPEPVSLKRFLALDFVFCFGMFPIINYYFALFSNSFLKRIRRIFLLNAEHCDYLLLLWCNEHNHSFAFQFWHLLHFSEFFQISGKTQEQNFTLVLVNNGTAFKENVCFQF